MSALTAKSKAFRATLQLRDHEVPILQHWAAMNCALHACFRSGRGTLVLVGLRAAPQSSASFARTLRSALRRFGVSTSGLRGHWLFLISEREATSLCLGSAEVPPELASRLRCDGGPLPAPPPPSRRAVDDSDERVVELYRR